MIGLIDIMFVHLENNNSGKYHKKSRMYNEIKK